MYSGTVLDSLCTNAVIIIILLLQGATVSEHSSLHKDKWHRQ